MKTLNEEGLQDLLGQTNPTKRLSRSFSETKLKGWEESLAGWEPSEGAQGALQGLIGASPLGLLKPLLDKHISGPDLYATAMTTLDTIPYGKYLAGSNREEWSSLTPWEQTKDLLWQGVGAALMVPAEGALVKGAATVGRLGSAGVKSILKRTIGLAPPVEDIIKAKWRRYDYSASVRKALTGKSLGLHKDEREAVAQALEGDSRALNNLWATKKGFYQKGLSDVPVTAMSKKLESSVRFVPDRGIQLNQSFKDQFSIENLRILHNQRMWSAGLTEASGLSPTKIKGIYGTDIAETSFKAYLRKHYDKDVAELLNFETAPDEVVQGLFGDMIAHPRILRQLNNPKMGLMLPKFIQPQRVLFGQGEWLFKTSSKIYEPIQRGFHSVASYTVGKAKLYNGMLAQRGLGTMTVTRGIPSFRPRFSRASQDRAFGFLRDLDSISEQLRKVKKGPERMGLLQKQHQLFWDISQTEPAVKGIIDTTRDFMDHLYGEQAIWTLWEIYNKAPLKATVQKALWPEIQRLSGELEQLFSTRSATSASTKMFRLKKILSEAQNQISAGAALTKRLPGGKSISEEELKAALESIKKGLTLQSQKGSFIDYLEAYLPRIGRSERDRVVSKLISINPQNAPYYMKMRVNETFEDSFDLNGLITNRVRAQGRRWFLQDHLDLAIEHAKELPTGWRELTENYIADAVGLPKPTDQRVADFLTSTLGRGLELLGNKGTFSVNAVKNISQVLRRLQHNGALGLNTVSALKNYISMLLISPIDIGGAKDYISLVRGIYRLKDKGLRDYLYGIGIITEAVPETARAVPFLPFYRGKFGEETSDFLMWLFQASDKHNRLATGAMALDRWEGALRKLRLDQGASPGVPQIPGFMKASGVSSRREAIRGSIEDSLYRGDPGRAKAIFVRDVVADTQFLYGALDAPAGISSLGELGRTGAIFQSWWMNYATLLEKWATTGSISDKLYKALSAATVHALAYSALRALWGESKALGMTFFGPIPQALSMAPFYGALFEIYKATYTAGELLLDAATEGSTEEEEKRLWEHLEKSLDKGVVLVPAGVQARRTLRGLRSEGPVGGLKSLMDLQKK